jgi:acyl carrier protein
MTEQAEANLRTIVRSVLTLPPGTDVTTARQAGVEAWDSLGHVSLMLALEGEFNLTIDIADQLRLTSYEAIKRYLDERGGGQ